jgi:hypothetical protein
MTFIALSAATSGVIAQGLSRGVRQHANTQRPPGRSALRICVNAGTDCSKNITPKREYSKSLPAGRSAWAASASRNER